MVVGAKSGAPPGPFPDGHQRRERLAGDGAGWPLVRRSQLRLETGGGRSQSTASWQITKPQLHDHGYLCHIRPEYSVIMAGGARAGGRAVDDGVGESTGSVAGVRAAPFLAQSAAPGHPPAYR